MSSHKLSAFVSQSPHLLQTHLLHNIRVIIDGYNLLTHLCVKEDVQHGRCGGEYEAFARKCRLFFTNLKACNIWCFVVFSGASASKDSGKHDRNVASHARRIEMACRIAQQQSNQTIMPVLAVEVLHNILKDLRIPFAVTDFKSANEIAGLANLWLCPVLAKDPTYFLMDIKAGLLPLDTLQWQNIQSYDIPDPHGKMALPCTRYFLSKFCQHFKLAKSLVPLFRFLLVTDEAQRDGLSFPSLNGVTSDVNKICKKLAEYKSMPDATMKLLGHLSMSQRMTIQDHIQQNLEFLKPTTTCNLAEYFTKKQITSHPKLCSEIPALPPWCYEFFRAGMLPNTIINIVSARQVFTLVQVEDQTLPSSNDLALPLRRILYCMLLPLHSTKEDQVPTVTEYDRAGSRLACDKVFPLYDVTNCGQILQIRDVDKLSVPQRRCFFLAVLEVDTIRCGRMLKIIPDMFKLPICVVTYWITNSWRASLDHVRALLVCWILGIAKQKSSRDDYKDVDDYTEHDTDLFQLMNWGRTEASALLSKFNEQIAPTFSSSPDDVAPIYSFSELQSCMKAVLHLNAALQHPFSTPDITFFYNGSLVHDMCYLMESLSDEYIEEWIEMQLMDGAPTATALYKILNGFVNAHRSVIDEPMEL